MNLKNVGIAVLVGFVTFAVVALALTELLASSIAFSAIVGIPTGIVAGILALLLTVVYMDQRQNKIASASGIETSKTD